MTLPSANSNQEDRKQNMRGLLLWLILIPIVFGSLMCCGQLALIQTGSQPGDPLSKIKADYQSWVNNIVVPRVNEIGLLGDLNAEARRLGTPVALVGTETAAPGQFWLQPTATAFVVGKKLMETPVPPTPAPANTSTATSVPLPSLTATHLPTATFTLLPPTFTPTNTLPPPPPATNTPVPVIPSNTPVTPTKTNTPLPPPTLTFTPSPTASLTPIIIPDTPTPKPTFTETPTQEVTPTPIGTLAGLRPIIENNGAAIPGGPTTCVAIFGYRNDNPVNVFIEVGDSNKLAGGGTNMIVSPEQPTTFSPGRVIGAFSVTWESGQDLVWTLQDRTATAGWCH